MAQTPTYGLHYPTLSDAPDVPQWVQDLAEDVETQLAILAAAKANTTQLPVFIRKPSNESVTSSITLQDDNDFAFAVAANSVYILESYLIYTGAIDGGTGAGGMRMQFTGPAGAAMTWTNFGGNTVGGVTAYNVVAESLTAGAPRAVPTNAGTAMTCQPKGTLVTSGTSGTLQFRWAQGSTNATATVLQANSWMKLTKIA
jgi:hypothetical protein